MITRRRVVAVLVMAVLAAVAWSAWVAFQTQRDLRDAEAALDRLRAAVQSGDDVGRDRAVADLKSAAAAARDRTGGVWWTALTKLPLYGDDAAGIEALSASIDTVAEGAVGPLVATVDSLDGLVAKGRIDPAQVAAIAPTVVGASAALTDAAELVEAHDSDGFVPALRTRYDEYADEVVDLAAELRAAATATEVLPGMLGADGPRDYLFVFQNNAEIRSTGGVPGSWARVHVDDGRIEIREQGSADDLNTGRAVAELTDEEAAVYDTLPAVYFQDPGFIPDFPRAARLIGAFWDRTYPDVDLDGVLSLDPVGMSYLLAGTGPVTTGPLTLTAESLVPELLSNTYAAVPDPAAQDQRFQEVARALLTAATSQLASPLDFVRGVAQAARERRMLVAPFDDAEAERLAGTAVEGALAGDDGATPHVDVGVNDGTGAKMSYYLRFRGEVRSQSCRDEVQELSGVMTLSQAIDPAEARRLPARVTASGAYGIPPGSQLVTLRIYGPYGGTVTDVRVDGTSLDVEEGLEIDGRPVATVAPVLQTTDDVIVTWRMTTGRGQTGPGVMALTPSIVPGTGGGAFSSAC